MIMMVFGALSAGTKTYLLCRSDRHAFTSTTQHNKVSRNV